MARGHAFDSSKLIDERALGSRAIAELRSPSARSRGFVYALPRTPKSYLFVFVASDEQSANELAQAFLTLRDTRDGALIEQLH